MYIYTHIGKISTSPRRYPQASEALVRLRTASVASSPTAQLPFEMQVLEARAIPPIVINVEGGRDFASRISNCRRFASLSDPECVPLSRLQIFLNGWVQGAWNIQKTM